MDVEQAPQRSRLGGYGAVGRVIEGMAFLDRINDGATSDRVGRQYVPDEPIVVESSYVAANEPPGWNVRACDVADVHFCD